MCGIAGIINADRHRPISMPRVHRMADAMFHRGPDEVGFFERQSIGLVNRRLAIVGLADGRQPISNEDGTVWVVFNGELYDHAKIRAELQAKGHHFRTTTDTELIPHLWEEYGTKFFEHLRGQFAFCLWTSTDDQLYLVRDRFGICPLFWSVRQDSGSEQLIFASEVKAMLASGLIERKPDLQGINQVFTFFALPGPMTCFANVQQITPGHFLQFSRSADGRFTIADRPYWELSFPDEGEEECPPEQVAIEEYERLFIQAVERRLQADVPVVSYLSGGVDSSLVTVVASKILGRPIPTFTVGIKTAGFDETNQAKVITDFLKTEPNVCEYQREDTLADYPKLIAAAEFPVVDASSASLLRLAGTVHTAGYKVALTGEGSDEFLAGYPWFKIAKVLRAIEVLPGVRLGNYLRAGALRLSRQPQFPLRLMTEAQDLLGGHNGWLDVYGMMSLSKLRFYTPDLQSQLIRETPYKLLNFNTSVMKRWHPFHRGIAVGARIMLAGHLLASKGDRVAMNSSVETRPPFLDEDLVAYTNRLHPRYKLRRFTDKYLLRKVARRWIPREIAERSKKMFRAPLDSFHLQELSLPKWINQLLSEESLRQTAYFDATAVQSWRDRIPKMRRSLSKTSTEMGLVAVLATQLWHHLYISGNLCELPNLIPTGVGNGIG